MAAHLRTGPQCESLSASVRFSYWLVAAAARGATRGLEAPPQDKLDPPATAGAESRRAAARLERRGRARGAVGQRAATPRWAVAPLYPLPAPARSAAVRAGAS